MSAPIAIDLFCGLGGWTEGLMAAGYYVVGFDIERHKYENDRYPGQLVLQDVRTLHGAQFRDAALIVASPPCQEFSYMAMPWSRAKQIARALRGEDEFPEGYKSRGMDWKNRSLRGQDFTGIAGAQAQVAEGRKGAGAGAEWFDANLCALPSSSPRRKAASARIAKIPSTLSRWIAETYLPVEAAS